MLILSLLRMFLYTIIWFFSFTIVIVEVNKNYTRKLTIRKNVFSLNALFSIIVLLSSIFIFFVENRLDKIEPYYKPIISASATIILDVSDNKYVGSHMFGGWNAVDFICNKDTLMEFVSYESNIFRDRKNRIILNSKLDFQLDSPGYLKPIIFLKNVEQINYFSFLLNEGISINNGKIIITLNSTIEIELPIDNDHIVKADQDNDKFISLGSDKRILKDI